ncbi:unnamed protein product [Linum tenue]|uniref:Uncharacterized protein n=1 Tax=Linum tenue TaxID=586396 RepID=A0AAV0QLA9_9ROSI|nr:unnamed protein product [Linum tenue]CAI0545846.1 unnamed protein product [Linum tenue]
MQRREEQSQAVLELRQRQRRPEHRPSSLLRRDTQHL